MAPLAEIDETTPNMDYILPGLAAHGVKADETLEAASMALARQQMPEGSWRALLQRGPMQEGLLTMTALALQAIHAYAPKSGEAEIAERMARAKAWLLKTPAGTKENRAMRLLGLKWAGASAEERKAALEALRAAQRPDGGWAWDPSLQSDAYATGEALYALNQAGDLPVTDPAYRKGVEFLLRTQEDDGTWFLFKRAIPANNYFDTGFPFGHSQFSSHAATSWATMALVLAAEPAKGSQAAAR
jgi:hypothetical protein